MNTSKKGFPVQKVPLGRKNKEWKENCVSYIVGCAESNYGSQDRVSKKDMQALYDLYNSKYDENRLKYVTNPFKQDDGFPATAQNVNLVKPQVDTLLGEEEGNPFNFTVIRTSSTTTTELQDKMKDDLMKYMMSAFYANMSEEDRLVHEEKLATGEIQEPEQIQRYYAKSYKDVKEGFAHKSLKYLRHKLDLDRVLKSGFKDALLSSEEIYYVGDRAGKPHVERVNPLYFYYETNPDMDFIHEASWCCRKMKMTHQDLYDSFFDKLSDKDLNDILASLNTTSGQSNAKEVGAQAPVVRVMESLADFNSGNTNENLVTVWHTCWQSYKQIWFVTLLDEEGNMQEFQTDESYHVTGEEVSIEKEWATETWEGYLANDVFFGVKPLDYQHIDPDTLNSTRLPYTGTVYYNTNSKPVPFAGFLEPLQYYYIMLWYRLELTLARDKGKVITMDITQIPKSWDIDVSKWMHMLNALGVNFINPYEEGWDVQGRVGGRAAGFNQFQTHDLSMAQSIGSYIDLLAKVEQMAESLTGITPQRKGDISSNELVGNVQQSIERSSNITEALFGQHRAVKKEVLSMLLNSAKMIWAAHNPGMLHYVFDDGERMFLELTDDFLFEDFDVFVTDSREEYINLQKLQSLYQAAMQNGAELLDIAEIMTINNITEIKSKLKEITEARQQREEAMAQQEQEANIQIEEMRREMQDLQLQDKEADRELLKYKIDVESQTKIQVATISTYRYQEDLDANNDGIPDPIQLGEIALKERSLMAEANKSIAEIDLKHADLKSKERQQDKKIKADKELQKQKDDAAYAREKLKATTALKNPVVGEKKSATKK